MLEMQCLLPTDKDCTMIFNIKYSVFYAAMAALLLPNVCLSAAQKDAAEEDPSTPSTVKPVAAADAASEPQTPLALLHGVLRDIDISDPEATLKIKPFYKTDGTMTIGFSSPAALRFADSTWAWEAK